MFGVTSGKSVWQVICVVIENLSGYMFQLSKFRSEDEKYVRLRFKTFLALSLIGLNKLLIFLKAARNIAVINKDINTHYVQLTCCLLIAFRAQLFCHDKFPTRLKHPMFSSYFANSIIIIIIQK